MLRIGLGVYYRIPIGSLAVPFFGITYRIQNINYKKELLRGLWVIIRRNPRGPILINQISQPWLVHRNCPAPGFRNWGLGFRVFGFRFQGLGVSGFGSRFQGLVLGLSVTQHLCTSIRDPTCQGCSHLSDTAYGNPRP